MTPCCSSAMFWFQSIRSTRTGCCSCTGRIALVGRPNPCCSSDVSLWERRNVHHVMQVYSTYRYTFDRVYGPDSQQQEVYEHSARDSVKQVLEVSISLSGSQADLLVHVLFFAAPFMHDFGSAAKRGAGLRTPIAVTKCCLRLIPVFDRGTTAGLQCGNHCIWPDRHRQDLHHGGRTAGEQT